MEPQDEMGDAINDRCNDSILIAEGRAESAEENHVAYDEDVGHAVVPNVVDDVDNQREDG